MILTDFPIISINFFNDFSMISTDLSTISIEFSMISSNFPMISIGFFRWFQPTSRRFQPTFWDFLHGQTHARVFFPEKKQKMRFKTGDQFVSEKKWVDRHWNKKLEVVLSLNVPTFLMFVYILNHTVINIQQFVKMYLKVIESN